MTNIRETDISACWPFPPHLLQRRMRKKTVPLLSPLEVPTFRYWQCLDCVVSELHEIRNEQQQIDNLKNDIDNLMNAPPVHGDGKFALEPSENEHKDLGNGMENHLLSRKVGNDLEEDGAGIEVAQCMEISERSGDASQELKAPAEPNLEFVHDKREVHCQDISRQSLPQDKFVKVCFFMAVL